MAIELCVEAMMGVAGHSGQVIAESLFYRRPRLVRDSPAELADTDLWLAVRDALPALSSQEAEAIWLVDVCRLSYADAARSMARPQRVVARRITTGRRKIRASLSA